MQSCDGNNFSELNSLEIKSAVDNDIHFSENYSIEFESILSIEINSKKNPGENEDTFNGNHFCSYSPLSRTQQHSDYVLNAWSNGGCSASHCRHYSLNLRIIQYVFLEIVEELIPVPNQRTCQQRSAIAAQQFHVAPAQRFVGCPPSTPLANLHVIAWSEYGRQAALLVSLPVFQCIHSPAVHFAEWAHLRYATHRKIRRWFLRTPLLADCGNRRTTPLVSAGSCRCNDWIAPHHCEHLMHTGDVERTASGLVTDLPQLFGTMTMFQSHILFFFDLSWRIFISNSRSPRAFAARGYWAWKNINTIWWYNDWFLNIHDSQILAEGPYSIILCNYFVASRSIPLMKTINDFGKWHSTSIISVAEGRMWQKAVIQ